MNSGYASTGLGCFRVFLLFLPVLSFAFSGLAEPQEAVDLSGPWRFRLDPENRGVEEAWFQSVLPDTVRLPGSLNENGIGNEVTPDTPWTGTLNSRMWHEEERFAPYREPGNTKILFWLQPEKHYIGAAWYQKEVEVPPSFAGKQVLARFERCHWETRLWVDGAYMGSENSLSVPHIYDLGALAPGRHTLTVRVDNTYSIEVGVNAHSVSDNTQTNWNGMVGALHLVARDLAHIEQVRTYPDIQAKQVRINAVLGNASDKEVSGTLAIAVMQDGNALPPVSATVTLPPGQTEMELVYPLGDVVRLWNEFDPALYELTASLQVRDEENSYADDKNVSFGMRDLGVEGTQFTLNGERIFLRGTLECAIFPRTGYPPTDVPSWIKILSAAKDHGLNHLRFHSWCPPEAAFTAGDQMGFLFQIEGPFWCNPGLGDPLDAYIIEECDRILETYGNHPSFGFLAYGNEPGGAKHKVFLAELLNAWKAKDARRLYTAASGWPMIEENQYHVTFQPRVHSNYGGKPMRFGAEPFASTLDYGDFVREWPVPIVSHEIGQWCVFPNLKEIEKYSGPLKPRNFEIVRDLLDNQGMLDQAEDFLLASGKLQTLCYKEEIEAALRTPGFGGFQLLDLHDFPGQGTALVGMLDPFWESKGYVTAEEFRRFCGPTVPLMRMETCVFTTSMAFHGKAEVTHFGPAALNAVAPIWRVKDASGSTLLEGTLAQHDLPRGSAVALGDVHFNWSAISAPAQVTLELSVGDYTNDWDLWVYPEMPQDAPPPDIHVVEAVDEAALSLLEQGCKVLLLPGKGTVAPPRFGQAPSAFPPIFWNTFWFPGQQLRTLGLLCDPLHPLFGEFPTDFHSNWQWWDLVSKARVMSLDSLPKDVRPLVQVIDDWNTCRRLGLVFEVALSNGTLLVCSMDIANNLEQRPAARQFRTSLLNYMASPAFAPARRVPPETLMTVFQEPSLWSRYGAIATADSEHSGFEAANVLDGDADTLWHTRWEGDIPSYPHWIRIDLEEPMRLIGLDITPRQDMTNGHPGDYRVYVFDDLNRRGRPVARGVFPQGYQETRIPFEQPKQGTHILLEVMRPLYEDHPWASLAEIRPVLEQQ